MLSPEIVAVGLRIINTTLTRTFQDNHFPFISETKNDPKRGLLLLLSKQQNYQVLKYTPLKLADFSDREHSSVKPMELINDH